MEEIGMEREETINGEYSVVFSGITYTNCLSLTLKEKGLGPDV